MVVGILARTSQSTSGSFWSNSARGVTASTDVSTGIERGGRGCEGVEVPGVAGGVNSGLIIDGGRWSWDVVLVTLFSIAFFPRSSSELWSSKGLLRFGFGE